MAKCPHCEKELSTKEIVSEIGGARLPAPPLYVFVMYSCPKCKKILGFK